MGILSTDNLDKFLEAYNDIEELKRLLRLQAQAQEELEYDYGHTADRLTEYYVSKYGRQPDCKDVLGDVIDDLLNSKQSHAQDKAVLQSQILALDKVLEAMDEAQACFNVDD